MICLINGRSALGRLKAGRFVDIETRTLEFGVLLAAFAPTQFFGPGGGLVPAISHMEYFSLTLGAVLVFVFFAGFVSFFREPSARKKVLVCWSPALAAVAVGIFIGLLYLPATGIGSAHSEGVMSATADNREPVPEYRTVLKTDSTGHTELLFPSMFADGADVSVVAVGVDGRTGAAVVTVGNE